MCPLHLTTDHDANDCKVLQVQTKRMQGMWEAKGKHHDELDNKEVTIQQQQ